LARSRRSSPTPRRSRIDLGQYTLVGTYLLPPVEAEEASAITYNWDTDTLFVLGDEGDALVEVSKTGARLSATTLTGFADTEGLTYIGNGQFVLTEERLRDAYRLSYTAGGTVDRATLPSKDLGSTIGNTGIEGISYDSRDGSFVTVKEISSLEVNLNQMDFDSPRPRPPSLPCSHRVSAWSICPTWRCWAPCRRWPTVSTPTTCSSSARSRGGCWKSRVRDSCSPAFDFGALAEDAEGVTMDFDGNIYVVAETGPTMFVLAPPTPVPLPPSLALALGGGVLIGLRARRR
jgi:hypothetical protein